MGREDEEENEEDEGSAIWFGYTGLAPDAPHL
jgi:hypothetical protein